MYKIAVLGDAQSVQGFAALGLQVCPAENAEQARPILHRLAKDGLIVVADLRIPALAVHAVVCRLEVVSALRSTAHCLSRLGSYSVPALRDGVACREKCREDIITGS